MKPKIAKRKNYLSNKEFTASIVKWQKTSGKLERVGVDIVNGLERIIGNYANKFNFRYYKYLDDMKSEALLHCLKGLFKFKIHKSENAFAFFTQTTHNAFIQTIEKEKKQVQISFDLTSENLTGSEKFDYRHENYQKKK